MKKLALIVLLAVVASRLLADRDDRWVESDRPHGSPVVTRAEFDHEPPAPPAPPHPPRGIKHAIQVALGRDDDDASAPKPPAPPEHGPRSKRHPARKATPPAPPISDTDPKVIPAWFPRSDWEEEGLSRPDASGARVLLGRLSASEDRARQDLRKTINHEVADWLAADVPMTWVPPRKLVDRLSRGTYVQTVTRSFGPKASVLSPELTPTTGTTTPPELDELYTLYRAGQKLDFSPARRAEFISRYHRDVASERMKKSGSIIAVVLAGLAVLSLYIRADEATKGYCTNRLRVLALAGLGVAGGLAYRYWA